MPIQTELTRALGIEHPIIQVFVRKCCMTGVRQACCVFGVRVYVAVCMCVYLYLICSVWCLSASLG